MKMMPQQYCLRWKHHHSNVQNMFAQLLEKERFCDVTLYCSPSFSTQVPNKDTVDPQNIRGVSLRAHRVVLAACSELLGALLGAHDELGEPVLVIDGAEPRHLRALLHYMYTGEMSVHHSQLASLLKTAEELRIKGLTDIRWNNKDEPPDCQSAGIITTASKPSPEPPKSPKPVADQLPALINPGELVSPELRAFMKREEEDHHPKFSANGGPPPLIKLESKDKSSPIKRDVSDNDTPSPKRQRLISGADNTDEESQPYSMKGDRDQEWQHGNMDISAERVVGWGGSPPAGTSRSWSRSGSEGDWADAPQDIGSFLHTRLSVPGDDTNDEDSNDSLQGPLMPSGLSAADLKVDMLHAPLVNKPMSIKGSCPVDPRFSDVVKLNDYLQHGRRPQFWEENYVRRVMEAVRLKELEMKQAAEILGVSYGTLYGRYRDVYGCINRPYRTARDFWQAKGPSEVLERLQRGEISLDAASQALGVTATNLAAYVADITHVEKDFEPIPIEIDPSLKLKPGQSKPRLKTTPLEKVQSAAATSDPLKVYQPGRKIMVGNMEDEDIPATVIATQPSQPTGKWPTLRVAQLDTLREALPTGGPIGPPTSPSQLMRTRPDLTIVAAKRNDKKDDNGE